MTKPVITVAKALAQSGIDSLDCEVLMAALLEQSRTWLFTHSDNPLKQEQLEKWQRMVSRRKLGEPVAYILGKQEFYGRPFNINPDVLIPRPSTEALVTQAINLIRNEPNPRSCDSKTPKPRSGGSKTAVKTGSDMSGTSPVEIFEADSGISVITRLLKQPEPDALIIDIGCGSGCIAVTLALELPDKKIIGVDISGAALKIASFNVKKYNVGSRVQLIKSEGSEFIKSLNRPFIMISNPPYIPNNTGLDHSVAGFEPAIALFAGNDGLSIIKPLLTAATDNPMYRGFAIECRTDQIEEILTS